MTVKQLLSSFKLQSRYHYDLRVYSRIIIYPRQFVIFPGSVSNYKIERKHVRVFTETMHLRNKDLKQLQNKTMNVIRV